MKPLFTLRHALDDRSILGGLIDGPSWAHWRALLIGAMGEPLTDEERTLFQAITERPAEPGERVEELWCCIGRRGGKTRALSVLMAYVAGCCDWSDVLAPGEVGVIGAFAATQRQAEIMLSYVAAIFSDPARPLLHNLKRGETQELVDLWNDTRIEVRPASYRTSRGISAIAVICDEIGFWSSGENAANPDSEILAALRPSLATTGGPLVAISSPHARKGELWLTYRDHYGAEGDPKILVANAPSRIMNPTLAQSVVDRAMARDPAAARAEYGAEFRTDVETFVALDKVDAAVVPGLEARPANWLAYTYFGFLDAAGGSGTDSITMAIAHAEGENVILDRVEEIRPPFSPEEAAEQFSAVFQSYRVTTVTADKWGAEWVASPFRRHGIEVDATAEAKSAIYLKLIPLLNSGRVALLDNARLRSQLVALERKSGPSGRDIIDHPRGGHDDVVNAAAGALTLAADSIDTGFDWGSDTFIENLARFYGH
jgi:hypothetical protein